MTKKRHFRSSARPRVACKVTMYRQPWTSDRPIVSYTRDIGTGGLFAITDEKLEIGDRLEVVLSTPSSWEPLILAAEICRVEKGSGEQPGGVGIRFVNVTDAQLLALANLTESLDFES